MLLYAHTQSPITEEFIVLSVETRGQYLLTQDAADL